ncbi:hypothetical protein NXS08_06990 [Gleimia sp. 6138-11-ORH1]|uniref:hypothetical protein n=1 Tax=Gleimia sp. 6138-11-ORH1 TaxID=2973937 RepID=UPI002167136F|nr:hypothetical protein [Gleimia sp. 6138-11-ORH1]MCS4485210.1 hypothetical protein [Gleimia sp. 6138-11-ORH1]
MNVKRLITTVAAGALALGLGACSAHPGVALIVDGKEYRTVEVTQAAQEASLVAGNPVQANTIIDFLSRLETAKELAELNGVDISMEQVRAELEKGLPEGTGPLSDITVETFYVNSVLQNLNQKLGQQAYSQLFLETQAERKVEINPRFGSVSEAGTMLPPSFPGVLDIQSKQGQTKP